MTREDDSGSRLTIEISDAAEVAKYAFDRKVEESGMRVLRSRLYPVIVVITALLSTFGVGLTWWVDKVAQRAESLNTSVALAKDSLAALNRSMEQFTADAIDLQLKADRLDIQMQMLAKRGEMVDAQSVSALTGAAVAQSSGAAAREMSIRAQDALSKLLSDIDRQTIDLDVKLAAVAKNAELSTSEREKIEAIRHEADKFAEAVKEHRNLVAATVVDSISLGTDDSSEITVPNLIARGLFKIRFETTNIEKHDGFDVRYAVNKGERITVKVSRDDIGRPIPIEGTDGQYQFMMEFIYKSRIAADFLTIRVAAAVQESLETTTVAVRK